MVKKSLPIPLIVILIMAVFVFVPQGKVYAAARTSVVMVPCSMYSCDNQDVRLTGCINGAVHLGAIGSEDTTHLQIWWSSACSTNFAEIQSPDGRQIQAILLERADQANTNCNVTACTSLNFNTILTCNVTFLCGGVNLFGDPNSIPAGGTRWETNMLYAPHQQVRVVVETACSPISCQYLSKWH